MSNSILKASFKSFCVSFFAMIGFSFGIISAILILGTKATTSTSTESDYQTKVVYIGNGTKKKFDADKPMILKLNISGVIGTEKLNMKTIRSILTETEDGTFENAKVKAILLHIESPGGTVVDADGIYRAIKDYKERHEIPVYAYVDGLCASGGMYIAAAADKIFASDVSLIGSIGVISPPIFNFSKVMETLGVHALTLSAGVGKDELNSFRPWKDNEGEHHLEIIKDYYQQFVDIVTSNRKSIDKTKLIEVYGARVFPAKQAKEYGFIDVSGVNMNETIKELALLQNLKDDTFQVVELEKNDWFSNLFAESSLFKGTVNHKIDIGMNLDSELMNQFLYLYRPGS